VGPRRSLPLRAACFRVPRFGIDGLFADTFDATDLGVTTLKVHLDVLPRQADKGKSLVWLARHLGVSARSILVAGDSGNDSMFNIPGVRGILVENARRELIETTRGHRHLHGNGHPGGRCHGRIASLGHRAVSAAAPSSKRQDILGIALLPTGNHFFILVSRNASTNCRIAEWRIRSKAFWLIIWTTLSLSVS
jgi:hypothetical protein